MDLLVDTRHTCETTSYFIHFEMIVAVFEYKRGPFTWFMQEMTQFDTNSQTFKVISIFFIQQQK